MNTRRGADEANRESHETSMSRDLQEMKDRLRRIETRLTRYLEMQGFDTERKLPYFKSRPLGSETVGEIEVPSMMTSIEDIVNAIPSDWNPLHSVRIIHKRALVCYVYPKEVKDGPQGQV